MECERLAGAAASPSSLSSTLHPFCSLPGVSGFLPTSGKVSASEQPLGLKRFSRRSQPIHLHASCLVPQLTTAVLPGGQLSQWPIKRPDDRALPTAVLSLHRGKIPSSFLSGLLRERMQHRRDVRKTMSRNHSGTDPEGIRSTGWHQRQLARGEEQGQNMHGPSHVQRSIEAKCLVPRCCPLESLCLLNIYHVQDAVPGLSPGTLMYVGWGPGSADAEAGAVRWRERPRPQARLRSKAVSPTVHSQALTRSPHGNRIISFTLAKLFRGLVLTFIQFIQVWLTRHHNRPIIEYNSRLFITCKELCDRFSQF